MDDSAAPWRALETVTPAEPAAAQQRNVLPLLGLGLASVLGIGAFLAATSSNSGGGSISVEGGVSAMPGVSGGPAAGGGVLVVEIVGAVDKPGVYRLPSGSRVGDLVTAAGGYGPRVDTQRAAHDLNLAAPLQDGQQVRVPSRDDAAAAPGSMTAAAGGGTGGTGALVNLNTATQSELEALPGIGPVTAGKIIGGRPFASVEELKSRKVIGQATFDKIRELVTAP
jgi:competence protein ComEA